MQIDFSNFTIWFNGILVAVILFVAKEVGGYVGAVLKSNKAFESKLSSVRLQIIDVSEKMHRLYAEQMKIQNKAGEEFRKLREASVRFELARRRTNQKEMSEFKNAIKTHHDAHRLTLEMMNKQKARLDEHQSHLVQLSKDLVMVKSKKGTKDGNN